MKILGGIYALSTWSMLLAFAVTVILFIVASIKYIVPNEGDEALIEIAEKALAIAKWFAFFSFLVFVVLSFISAGMEYIAYGGIVSPTLSRVTALVMRVADKMKDAAGKFLHSYQFTSNG